MRKKLVVFLLAFVMLTLSACRVKKSTHRIEDDFHEPQINVPKIYISKGAGFTTNDQLETYLLRFIKVTFDDSYTEAEFNTSVNRGSLGIDKLQEASTYEIEFKITYRNKTKSQYSIVEIVERGVIGVEEISEITPFQPSINMDGSKPIIDYVEGLKLIDTDGTEMDEAQIHAAISNGTIVIDDTTVRLSVPGTHLVKFIITCENGYKYYYYREVKVLEASVPTKAEFDEYFVYDSEGLQCKRGRTSNFPTYFFVPSKFNDGTKIVKVTKYNTTNGCNFRDVGSVNDLKYFRAVDVIIYDQGHTELPAFFFALSHQNKETSADSKNTPSISQIHLPETLTFISSGVISGTDIKNVIIPRSVEKMTIHAFASAWKVETVIFLGMPTTDSATRNFAAGSTGAIVEYFFTTNARKAVYFYADYMLGISSDTKKNELFREAYLWIRKTGHTHNLNSFTNYNKIIL